MPEEASKSADGEMANMGSDVFQANSQLSDVQHQPTMEEIDTDRDGKVSEEELASYLAANPVPQFGSSRVRISGMRLRTENGERSYNGINGEYERTSEVVNGRAVYRKKEGQAAMWWVNKDGELCWAVGPCGQVGSQHIWAYVTSIQPSPDLASAAWHVYSYASLCYEEQPQVRSDKVEDESALSPSPSSLHSSVPVRTLPPVAIPPEEPVAGATSEPQQSLEPRQFSEPKQQKPQPPQSAVRGRGRAAQQVQKAAGARNLSSRAQSSSSSASSSAAAAGTVSVAGMPVPPSRRNVKPTPPVRPSRCLFVFATHLRLAASPLLILDSLETCHTHTLFLRLCSLHKT